MRIVTTRRTMVAVIVLLSLLLSITFIHCSSSQQQYTLFLKKASKSSSALHASNYHIAQGHHFHTRTLSNTPAVESLQDYPVGWVEFNDTIQSTGWATLQVKTSDQHDNEHQSFGAGYLEGFATAHLIGPYWNAFKEYNYNNTLKASFDQFMTKQFQYMENKVFDQQKGKSSVDPFQKQFWNQVGLILAQVKGIKSGYEQRRNANPDSLIEMSFLDVLKFQYNVDAPDIEQSFSPTDLSHMNRDEISLFALLHSKCSALVKYTSDRSNLLMTHSTWDTFANQLRVYKHFELNFHESNDALPVRQASKLVSFSSTPGWITSADDFYITSNGLMVTETTNNIFTQSLYKYVTPTTVPYWIRNAVANRMANNAPEWTKYFAMENSGTYNNQWMIVDTNKFVAGSSKSHPDMFHVLEQIPGKITTGSASEQLDQLGYWASYNIPFYPDIFNASGYPEMVRKHGDEWTHDHCPRANIFREFQNSAQDVESLKPVIRRNEWQNDPFALGDACNQIAARCDLNPPQASHYRAFGQIDAKLTDIKLVKQMKAVAQNGPTHSGTNKPFSWVNNHFENTVSHVLQPNTFNFGYEAMQPKYPFPSK